MDAEYSQEEQTRLNELKYQVKDLKLQLQFINERDREGRLRDELVDAYANIDKITNENEELQIRMHNLQNQLIQTEAIDKSVANNKGNVNIETHFELINELSLVDDGSREKEMDIMYIKAKKDKEKAIKILIQLIGKDKIAEYLDDNVGSFDILDRIYEGVMSKHIGLESDKKNKHKNSFTPVSSPPTKEPKDNSDAVSTPDDSSPKKGNLRNKKVVEEEEEETYVPHLAVRHKTIMVKKSGSSPNVSPKGNKTVTISPKVTK